MNRSDLSRRALILAKKMTTFHGHRTGGMSTSGPPSPFPLASVAASAASLSEAAAAVAASTLPMSATAAPVDELCELIHQYRLDQATTSRLVYEMGDLLVAEENAAELQRGPLRVLAALAAEQSGAQLPSQTRLHAFNALARFLDLCTGGDGAANSSDIALVGDALACLAELTQGGTRPLVDPDGARAATEGPSFIDSSSSDHVFGPSSATAVTTSQFSFQEARLAVLLTDTLTRLIGHSPSAADSSPSPSPRLARVAQAVLPLLRMAQGWLTTGSPPASTIPDPGFPSAQQPASPADPAAAIVVKLIAAIGHLLAQISDAAVSSSPTSASSPSSAANQQRQQQLAVAELRTAEASLGCYEALLSQFGSPGIDNLHLIRLIIDGLCRVVNVSSCSAASWQVARRLLAGQVAGPFGVHCLCDLLTSGQAQMLAAIKRQQSLGERGTVDGGGRTPDPFGSATTPISRVKSPLRSSPDQDSGRSSASPSGSSSNPTSPPPRAHTPSSSSTAGVKMASQSPGNSIAMASAPGHGPTGPSVKLLRGAVFLLGMACWSSQRIESLDVPAAAMVNPILAALDCSEPIVVYEVSLAVRRLVKKYGPQLHAEWPLVWHVIAQLEPLAANAPSTNARTAFVDVLRDTVNAVEQLRAAGHFHGDQRELWAAHCLVAPYQSEPALVAQLEVQSADMLAVDAAGLDNWLGRVRLFALTYFSRETRPPVRLAALAALAQVHANHRQFAAVELVDKIALPIVGATPADDLNADVARAAIRLFTDIAIHLTSNQFYAVVAALKRAAVFAVAGATVRVLATIALVDILRAKFDDQPAGHALHIAVSLTGHLDQPEARVRYQILTLVGQLTATARGYLRLDGRLSPYVRCFVADQHPHSEPAHNDSVQSPGGGGGGGGGGSTGSMKNIWPMAPVIEALCRRLRDEDDSTNFLLTLRALHNLLSDRNVLTGVDLLPLLHQLCDSLSNSSIGSRLQASTADRDSIHYLAFDVLNLLLVGNLGIQRRSQSVPASVFRTDTPLTAGLGADVAQSPYAGQLADLAMTPSDSYVTSPFSLKEQLAVVKVFTKNLDARAKRHAQSTSIGRLSSSALTTSASRLSRSMDDDSGGGTGSSSGGGDASVLSRPFRSKIPPLSRSGDNRAGGAQSSQADDDLGPFDMQSNLDVARICLNGIAVCICEFGSPANFPSALWSSLLQSCATLSNVPEMVPLVLKFFNLIATVLGRQGLVELARQEWRASRKTMGLDEGLLRVIRIVLDIAQEAERHGTPSANAANAYQVLGRWFLALPQWRRSAVLPIIQGALEQQRLPPRNSRLAEACLGMFARFALTDAPPASAPRHAMTSDSRLFADAPPAAHWIWGNAVISVRAGSLGFFEVVARRPHGCDVWLMQADPAVRDTEEREADQAFVASVFAYQDEIEKKSKQGPNGLTGAVNQASRTSAVLDDQIDKVNQLLANSALAPANGGDRRQQLEPVLAQFRSARSLEAPHQHSGWDRWSLAPPSPTQTLSVPGNVASGPSSITSSQEAPSDSVAVAAAESSTSSRSTGHRLTKPNLAASRIAHGEPEFGPRSSPSSLQPPPQQRGLLAEAGVPLAHAPTGVQTPFAPGPPGGASISLPVAVARRASIDLSSSIRHASGGSNGSSDSSSFAPLMSYGDEEDNGDLSHLRAQLHTSPTRRASVGYNDAIHRAALEATGSNSSNPAEPTTRRGNDQPRSDTVQPASPTRPPLPSPAPAKAGGTGNEDKQARKAAVRKARRSVLSAGFIVNQLHQAPFIDEQPLPLPQSDQVSRALAVLDRTFCIKTHKIGLLYVAPGQREARQFLANQFGSPRYYQFLRALGNVAPLADCPYQYTGGLDRSANESDGQFGLFWADQFVQVVFHVATFMPSRPKEDPGFTNKMRHIGNNYVNIVFCEATGDCFPQVGPAPVDSVAGGIPLVSSRVPASGGRSKGDKTARGNRGAPSSAAPATGSRSSSTVRYGGRGRLAPSVSGDGEGAALPFDPQCIKGQFNFVNVVITPRPGGLYKVDVLTNKPGLPSFGPITKSRLVSEHALPYLVRHTALSADIAAGQFLDGDTPRPSNAETRLKQIQKLRELL